MRCRPHTWAGVADADDGSGGLLSQLSVHVEDWDGESSGATQQKNDGAGVLCLVRTAEGKLSL